MRIMKVLNNNAVMVKQDKQEKIVIGLGVGFQKGKNDLVNPNKIEKIFVLEENEKFEQLLKRIPEEHFIISENIIAYAEEQLQTKLNSHIHLALTDHLSFAIERERQGIQLRNKLLSEIRVLYREEFEIGLWAIQHIKEQLGIDMPVDEAAYIALHIHTMKIRGGDLRETVKLTTIVGEIVHLIEKGLKINISKNDLAYERLITHLYYMLDRVSQSVHALDQDMLKMIKRKFPKSFRCSEEIAEEILTKYNIKLPEEELGYITLHIERIRNVLT